MHVADLQGPKLNRSTKSQIRQLIHKLVQAVDYTDTSFCQTGSNFFQKIFVFISIKNPLV